MTTVTIERLVYETRNSLTPRTDLRTVVRFGVAVDGRVVEYFDRRKDAQRLVDQIERTGKW